MSDDVEDLLKQIREIIDEVSDRAEEVKKSRELADEIGDVIEGEQFGIGMEALILVSVKTICAMATSRMHAMGLSAHMCRQIMHGCEKHEIEAEETKLQ